MAWKEVKLKELISDMGDGGTPTTTEPSNFGGEIPWAVVDDVVPKIRSTKESLTEKGFKGCSAKKWPIGSIILTTGATIGQVGIAEIDLCTKQGITGIVVNSYANADFLKFWFESNTKQLLRFAQGTTFKEIRPRTLGNLRIIIPNPFTSTGLDEQTAIATLLSKVDEAIVATQNSIKAAEKLKKSLLQNLLSGKLKTDGTWRTEDEFFEDEKFGKVPKGWKKEKFKTLIKHKTGYTWSKDQEIKFPEPTTVRILTVTNIQKELDLSSELYLKDVSEVDKIKKAVSKDWSIAVSSNGNRSRIGNAVYIKEDTEYLFASFLTAFKPKKDSDILSEYFFRWLTSHNIQGRITAVSEGTTGLGNLNIRFLRNIEITYPENQSEQADITDKVNSIEKITKEKQAKIQTLQRLKKSLMQNLLTGKVRLPAEFIALFEEAVEEVNKTVKTE